jgi:hypothetical protein
MSLKINISARDHLTKRFHESSAPNPVDPFYLEIAQFIATSMIDEIKGEHGDNVKINSIVIEISE